MAIIDPKVLGRGLKTAFFKVYEEVKSGIAMIATIIQSDGAEEDYAWLGAVPMMREFNGERKIVTLDDYEYTIRNKKYEATIGVKADHLEDDRTGQYFIRAKELGEEAKLAPDRYLVAALIAGSTSLCYDGQYFFDTDHPIVGGTQSNVTAGTGVTLAQIKADFIAKKALMAKFQDGVGRVLGIVPDTIVCPVEIEETMRELFKAEVISSTTNTLSGQIKNIIADPRLTDVNDWYLLCLNKTLKPLILQKRYKKPKLNNQLEESGSGFMRDEYAFGVKDRWNVGYGRWMYAYKVTNT